MSVQQYLYDKLLCYFKNEMYKYSDVGIIEELPKLLSYGTRDKHAKNSAIYARNLVTGCRLNVAKCMVENLGFAGSILQMNKLIAMCELISDKEVDPLFVKMMGMILSDLQEYLIKIYRNIVRKKMVLLISSVLTNNESAIEYFIENIETVTDMKHEEQRFTACFDMINYRNYSFEDIDTINELNQISHQSCEEIIAEFENKKIFDEEGTAIVTSLLFDELKERLFDRAENIEINKLAINGSTGEKLIFERENLEEKRIYDLDNALHALFVRSSSHLKKYYDYFGTDEVTSILDVLERIPNASDEVNLFVRMATELVEYLFKRATNAGEKKNGIQKFSYEGQTSL